MDEIVAVTPWTPLSYKRTLENPDRYGPSQHWFPDPTDAERIASYYTLSLYLANAARTLLADPQDRPAHREYGDPILLRDRIVAGVLGADWSITVDGAGADVAAGPSTPEPPTEPVNDAQEFDYSIYEAKYKA